MGEKRLIYAILFNNYYQIREVDEDGYCRRLSPTGIIDSLNELKGENELLKQQLKTKHVVNKQYEELQRLKEENERLRRDKAQLKERLRECGMRLDRFNCR